MGLKQAHHPLAHIGVEGIVRAAHHNVLAFKLPARLEVRRPHADAKRPRFGTSSHDATVVIGEHHHRPTNQGWVQALFAGCIEIVPVNEGGDLGHVTQSGWMT